jgi:hypothetical protein
MVIEFIFPIATVVSSIGVIIGAAILIYRAAKKIESAIGQDREGRTLSERLARVEHQLWENGGSSLADRVNNIERHAIKTTSKLELIEKLITKSNLILNSSNDEPKTISRTRVKKPPN